VEVGELSRQNGRRLAEHFCSSGAGALPVRQVCLDDGLEAPSTRLKASAIPPSVLSTQFPPFDPDGKVTAWLRLHRNPPRGHKPPETASELVWCQPELTGKRRQCACQDAITREAIHDATLRSKHLI
jgi:hypothetical protein